MNLTSTSSNPPPNTCSAEYERSLYYAELQERRMEDARDILQEMKRGSRENTCICGKDMTDDKIQHAEGCVVAEMER